MISDVEHVQKSTTNPEFFQCFELDGKFPGPSRIKIQVMDKHLLRSDRNLGETVIDLEDRWFHPTWTAFGAKKPLEVRHYFHCLDVGVLLTFLYLL